MPIYIDSRGYDRLQYWKRMELRRLYQAEGFSTSRATRMAGVLYEAIRNLNRKEIYSWSKARELEEPSGNANDLQEIASNYEYEYLDYGDDVWNENESFAMPDKREIAHYERLRNKRMRLTPEVKEVRRKVRAEERKREREVRREKERARWREFFGPIFQQLTDKALERQRQREAKEKEEFDRLMQRATELREKLTRQTKRRPITDQGSE